MQTTSSTSSQSNSTPNTGVLVISANLLGPMDISKPTSTAPSIRWIPCACHCTSAFFPNGLVCGLRNLEPNPYLRKLWRSESQEANLGGGKMSPPKTHSSSHERTPNPLSFSHRSLVSERHFRPSRLRRQVSKKSTSFFSIN